MIITTTNIFLAFLHVVLLVIPLVLGASFHSENINGVKCLQRERQALLQFKAEPFENYSRLSSWETLKDCCQWEGVRCDNRTNHVVALDLSGFGLSGGKMISPSLLELVDLNRLDLSFNNFNDTEIPAFIGSLGKLRYLNLKGCQLRGMIPHSLQNLSMLEVLDLSSNWPAYSNLQWLSSLQSLEYLDLSYLNYTGGTNIWLAISKLPTIKEIHLRDCSLFRSLPAPVTHHANASNSLHTLDLSSNHINLSSILSWILHYNSTLRSIDFSNNYIGEGVLDALKYFRSLSHLDLSSNELKGRIPDTLGNLLTNLSHLSHLDLSRNQLQGNQFLNQGLRSLTFVDLSHNKLQGELTHFMVQFWDSKFLEHLDLSYNSLFGSLPNMSRFRYLRTLNLAGSHLNGSIIEDNLCLSNLEHLDLSENNFTGRIPNLLSFPFLRRIYLRGNMLNGTLTEGIGNMFQLERLDLSSNHLEGLISESHLFNLSNMQILSLSSNPNLTIRINASWKPPFQLDTLGLASCRLGPHFPKWLQNQKHINYLDISNAQINDTIPNWFWKNFHRVWYLKMSHNKIHGVLPDLSFLDLSFVDLSFNEFNGSLPRMPPYADLINLSSNKFSDTIMAICSSIPSGTILDLSNNLLLGEILPHCFIHLMDLQYLNLANNNLSGNIQTEYSTCGLTALYLRNNSFTGHIPKSLMACHDLVVLDLGENKFNGNIPNWLGESLPKLAILSLKSNQLHGSLPLSICHLSKIQLLDISINKISSTIPKCVNNFTMLSSESNFHEPTSYDSYSIFGNTWEQITHDSASIIWKGMDVEYINNLWLLKVIDLSSNSLLGEIPHEITSLRGLVGLNLSRNNLVGSIPRDIGQLKILNSLDLFQNNLSGSIPYTISQLSHLGMLDLSFNNLSGKIPFGGHMDTFNASSYTGNPGLCGPPLINKPCPGDVEKPKNAQRKKHEVMFNVREFYVSMALGFSVAFLGVCWTLFFNKKWNVVTTRMFIHVEDWMYVKILVSKRRLQRHFENH